MMWSLLYARADGSYIVNRNGLPYHVTQTDPLFGEVAAKAAASAPLPAEPSIAISPPAVNPRVLRGDAFLSLFTDAEFAAMTAADPRILRGAFKVAAQDSCNLDSAECAALLDLAVSKGALTETRKAQILANQAPA